MPERDAALLLELKDKPKEMWPPLQPQDPGEPSTLKTRTEMAAQRSWADCVSNTYGTNSGMTLRFIRPLQEDLKVIVAPLPEVEDSGAKQWDKCLVGYFLDSGLPLPVIKSIALKIWRKHSLFDVIPIGDGCFLFKFSQAFGAKDVLEGGPWIFAGRYLVLRWWSIGLSLAKETLSSIPVWVQLSGIPLEYWSAEGLSHIASAVGIPLYADAATEDCFRVSFARICVEVDASVPLLNSFETEVLQTDGSSSLCTIGVSY